MTRVQSDYHSPFLPSSFVVSPPHPSHSTRSADDKKFGQWQRQSVHSDWVSSIPFIDTDSLDYLHKHGLNWACYILTSEVLYIFESSWKFQSQSRWIFCLLGTAFVNFGVNWTRFETGKLISLLQGWEIVYLLLDRQTAIYPEVQEKQAPFQDFFHSNLYSTPE